MRTKSKPGPKEAPPTNFDEVKRRFIRQNRELAKSNSSLSLRIRTLENEASRLLQDNLELRSDILQLQNELYDARSQTSVAAVGRVKDEIQAKLAELGALIGDIEVPRQGTDERLNVLKDRPWPVEAHWRERQPLAELMRDAQMPVICEDKHFHRATLDTDQIQAIRLSGGSSNESPDLGPPPVAHFDYESHDPIKFNAPSVEAPSMSPAKQVASESVNYDLPEGLSMNLETRRRRKDGQPRSEGRRSSILPPSSPAKRQDELPTAFRAGAKRKLADRESEKAIKPPSKGDFAFSRKVSVEESKHREELPIAKQETPIGGTEAEKTVEIASSPARPVRKVLGDKSANMSPRKVAPSDKAGKEDTKKQSISNYNPTKGRTSARSRRVSSLPVPSPKQDIVVETVEIRLQGEEQSAPRDVPMQTPAPPDFFSPTPSEASAKADEGRRGTPPPGDLSDLSGMTSMISDAGGRPSRRARSAVNYAEPSLVAKMRRPDKKMVDALSGLQDPRRTMGASTEKKMRSTEVKDEPGEDDGEEWKNLPSTINVHAGSPLQLKSTTAVEAHQALQTALENAAAQHSSRQSAASSAVSAILAANRRQQRSPQTVDSHEVATTDVSEETARKLEELDLYDFKESSPASTSSLEAPAPDAASRRRTTTHRRHSSIPRDLGAATETGKEAVVMPMDSSETMTTDVPSRGGGRERTASRRRSMML